MVRFYFVFFGALLVSGESLSNNRAIKIVDLYNTDLAYFQDFLTSNNVENLQYSTENIDYGQIAILRQASDSFNFLKSEIIRWCSYTSNGATLTANLNVQSLTRNGNNLGDKTTLYLNKMKNKFIEIKGIQQSNWDPNFKATIKMTDSVLNLQTISGNLPKDVDWNSLFAEAKIKGHAEIKKNSTNFESNITRAIKIIENVLNQIIETTNTYDDLDITEMSAKCSPVLNLLLNPKAGHQMISSSSSSLSASPLHITKEIQDQLTSGGDCGSFWSRKPICYAKLSKNTMTQIEKFYSNTMVLNQFLGEIDKTNGNADCQRRLKDFFKNRYVTWAYKSQSMSSDQFLMISICTKTNGFTLQIA